VIFSWLRERGERELRKAETREAREAASFKI